MSEGNGYLPDGEPWSIVRYIYTVNLILPVFYQIFKLL